jgi:hypothetical protein
VLKFAGIANITKSSVKGAQVAGIANLAESVEGLQIAGIANVAKRVKGTQIGLINVAENVEVRTDRFSESLQKWLPPV